MRYTYQHWYQGRYVPYYPYAYYEKQIGIGIDVVGGMEYTLKNTPISFFGDVNIYMEFYEYPFWLALQAGVGARFNF